MEKIELNENSELTLNQLYQLNEVNSRKFQFERKLIKGAFDTFNSSKLMDKILPMFDEKPIEEYEENYGCELTKEKSKNKGEGK